MGSLTNSAEVDLLDHALNKTAYTPATTLYVALCTADPTDAATGGSCNEVPNSNNYARATISFGTAASRMISNDATVQFNQAQGGGWGTATHYCVIDTNTYGSGQALGHGALATQKTINEGNTPSIAIGEVDISFSAGEISNYLANKLLDLMFDNVAYTSPTTYIALCTATIADGDTGSSITEPSGYGYARKLVYENAGGTPDWDMAVEGDPSYVDNNDDITIGPASGGSWGTIVATCVCDAATVGEVLFYDNDMTDQEVADGDSAKFPAGDFDVQAS